MFEIFLFIVFIWQAILKRDGNDPERVMLIWLVISRELLWLCHPDFVWKCFWQNRIRICNIFPIFPVKLIGDTCLASIKFIKTLPGTS